MRKHLLLAAALLLGVSACGGDVGTSQSSQSSGATSNSVTAPSSMSTTESSKHFGDGYIGAPVAFWFWAPY